LEIPKTSCNMVGNGSGHLLYFQCLLIAHFGSLFIIICPFSKLKCILCQMIFIPFSSGAYWCFFSLMIDTADCRLFPLCCVRCNGNGGSCLLQTIYIFEYSFIGPTTFFQGWSLIDSFTSVCTSVEFSSYTDICLYLACLLTF